MAIRKLSAAELRDHKGVSFVGVSTCFFCYDGQGEFFMAKRSQKARDEQGTWEIGAGGLEWGQTPEENVLREVMEEYAAEPLDIKFIGYWNMQRHLPGSPPTHWVALAFAVLVNHSEVKINEPDKFDDSGWFTLENLPSPLHSQQLVFFEKYAKELRPLLRKKSRDQS